MTVTQTVTIPADHRVFFEFIAPQEIPTGKAKVEVKLTPVVEKQAALKTADEEISPHPHSDALFAILSQPTPRADALLGAIPGASDITLEQIKDERLAKHSRHIK